MTTILNDDTPEFKAGSKKTRTRTVSKPKPILTTGIQRVNRDVSIIIPNHEESISHTRHYKGLKKAAAVDTKNRNSQVNLHAEREFIEYYESQGIPVYDGLEDPLDDVEKGILHDNFRREGAVRRAITFIAQFMLGKRTKVVLDTVTAFASEEREDQQLQQLNSNPLCVSMLDDVASKDDDVNLYNRLLELIISAWNYGRAVLVKQYDQDGVPVRLVPLFSVRLGKVYVNADTHELLGVEYKDYEGEARILDAKDIIYFTVDDYPITPNSRYYGLPPAETTMYLSLTNRVTIETAINEAVVRHWANARIIKAPSIQGQTALDSFASKLKPGKDIVTNQENLSVENVELDVDVTKIIESLSEREKEIFRALSVPLVVGFQDEQNRATAQSSLHQWTEGVLKDRRTSLRNVIEEQWYKPLLSALIRKRQRTESLQTTELPQIEPPILPETLNPELPQVSAQQLPNVPVYLDQNLNLGPPLPLSVADIDPLNPPFRIKMTFDDIIFDTFVEKSDAVAKLVAAGVLTREQALEAVGLERFIEQAQIDNAQQQQGQPTNQQPNQPQELSEVPKVDTKLLNKLSPFGQ